MHTRITHVLLGLIALILVASQLRPAAARADGKCDAGTTDVVRTRLIELVDDQGKARATLKVEPQGEAILRLFDSRGTIRVKLGASADGSGLVLLNEATEPAIQLLAQDTKATIALSEKDKPKRVIEP